MFRKIIEDTKPGKHAGNKRPFTLLELFICLLLLAMVGGLVSLKGGNFINSHKIRRAGQKIVQELMLSQTLAGCHESDMESILQCDDKGLIFLRKTDEPLPKTAHLFDREKFFSEFQQIFFNGHETKKLHMLSSHTGRTYPEGRIIFHGKNANEKFEFAIENGSIVFP